MAKTIFVRSAKKDRKVVLSEGHEDHPGGEAWVVGYPDVDGADDPMNIVEVGQTALVRGKVASGELLEVEKPMARQQAAAPAEKSK